MFNGVHDPWCDDEVDDAHFAETKEGFTGGEIVHVAMEQGLVVAGWR